MFLLNILAYLLRVVNRIIGKTQQVVFFDTNCYWEIAKQIPGEVDFSIRKILVCEAWHNKLGCANYLVLAEMLKHLAANPPDDNYY